ARRGRSRRTSSARARGPRPSQSTAPWSSARCASFTSGPRGYRTVRERAKYARPARSVQRCKCLTDGPGTRCASPQILSFYLKVVAERVPVDVGHLAHADEELIDQRPDAKAAEREQLEDAEARLAEIEAISAEDAREDREEKCRALAPRGRPGDRFSR